MENVTTKQHRIAKDVLRGLNPSRQLAAKLRVLGVINRRIVHPEMGLDSEEPYELKLTYGSVGGLAEQSADSTRNTIRYSRSTTSTLPRSSC